jgi:dGTPase
MDYVNKKLANIVDDNQQVQFIRAKWIGLMIGHLKEAFLKQESALLEGALEKSLLDCLNEKDCELISVINRHSIDKVYSYRSVLEIEVAGYHVIGGLLKAFVGAVLDPKHSRSDKLLQMVPRQFPINGQSLYADVQSVVDFIAGMTDLYAMDLYRKITGITISELR